MSAPPYMKLYVADYLGDTHHLGVVEHGAYLLLLMAMWRSGGSLPAADANLAKLARCTPDQWDEIRDSVLSYFKRSRSRLTHKRLGEELAKYENTSGKRSEAGKRGASQKALKNNGPTLAIADQTNKQLPTYPEPESEEERQEPPKPPKGGSDDLFGEEPEPAKRSRRKAATPIPDEFPSAEAIVEEQLKARAAGADVDAAYQAERFRNWALGKDARYADWGATWRNWMVRTVNDAPKTLTAAQPTASVDPVAVWKRRAEEYRKNSYWNRLDWGPPPGKPGCKLAPEIVMACGYVPAPIETGVAA